jgi:hypothetical protein
MRPSGLDSLGQRFLWHGRFVCYCAALTCGGVVIIIIMCTPLTIGSSPCLCSCVVGRPMYVDIINF